MIITRKKNDLKKVIYSILEKEENVNFAYLFGSTAKMKSNKHSDVDIGVYLSKDIVKKNKFYPEQLAAKIEKKINKPVDVRVLNHQNLIFLHQVLKYGELLICKNDKKRILFETRIYDEYLDFKYFIDRYNTIRRERLSL